MNQTLSILFVAVICSCIGCSSEPVAPAKTVTAIKTAQEVQYTEGESSFSDKFDDLVDHAKSNTPSMDDVKTMLTSVGDTTEKTTDDAMAWANEMYKSLSEQGKTHTGNVKDWIAEDWNNASAWEYQVISVDDNDPAMLQEKLNEAGKQRWDCFHVSDGGTATTFYMKRQKKSYMKNLPLRDMLKLVPLVPLLDSE